MFMFTVPGMQSRLLPFGTGGTSGTFPLLTRLMGTQHWSTTHAGLNSAGPVPCTDHWQEGSSSTWLHGILLLCQLANPLLSLHFIHTYVKCWQPHDNSLFSVHISIQEVLKMISGCPFYFGKGHSYLVSFTCVRPLYTHA